MIVLNPNSVGNTVTVVTIRNPMKSAGVIPATVPVPELAEPGHLLLIHVSIVELLMLTLW